MTKKTMRRSEIEKLLQEAYPAKPFFDGRCYLLENKGKKYSLEPLLPAKTPLVEEFLNAKVAVVLVRLGEYAIGFFEGSRLVVYKAGRHFIRGRTKKGGSSSSRYSRIRQHQRKEFLDNLCFDVNVLLSSSLDTVDYIIFGGARPTVRSLMERCKVLQQHEAKIAEKLLSVRHPNLRALQDAPDEIWSFYVAELP